MNRPTLPTIIHQKYIFLTSVVGFFISVSVVSAFGHAADSLLPLFFLLSLQIFFRFKQASWLFFFFLFGLAFWFWRTSLAVETIEQNISILRSATHNFTQRVEITGRVLSLMKSDDTRKIFLLQTTQLEKIPLDSVKFQLQTPLNSWVKEGDIISLKETISLSQPSEDFAYDKYFQSKDIYGTIIANQIRIQGNSLSWFDVQIITLRKTFLSQMNAIYPPRTAAFLGGLLFGDRQNLDTNIDSDFKLSGLSHVVAVSGFNITILIIFCTFLFRRFPTWIRLAIITSVIGLFLALVGDQISALRAAIMWLAGYYAVSFGRKADIFLVLAWTALFFVFLHPYTLNYDVSFHLSFLAVLGMIYTTPFFLKIFSRVPGLFWLKEALIATLGALSFTFPISLVSFGQLPLLTPLANIFATPLIPLTMFFGFLSIVTNLLSHTIAVWIGFIGWWFLEYILSVAHIFAGFKKTILQVDFSGYGLLVLSGYYLCLVYIIFWSKTIAYTSSSGNPSSRSLSWESINEE